MKKSILPLAFIVAVIISCGPKHSHDHETVDEGPEPAVYTIYTDKTELFVEFQPLIVGTECKFAAHFTELGESFKAFTEGTITLTLNVNGKTVSVTAVKPEVPGIFRLRLTPKMTGKAQLIFDIKTKNFTDRIIIKDVKVYADEKTALADQAKENSGGGDITFLKEQAWKIDFANTPLKKQEFTDVIKTSGQLLSAPGDEMIVVAKADGIVSISGKSAIVGTAISAGSNMFKITGGDLAVGNIDAQHKQALLNYEKAKLDYERASELVKDKIISEKEFQQSKLAWETAQTAYATLSKNYSSSGKNIAAPMSGYIKNILVTDGQFVSAGTPLATISKNKKLLLQANVSQKYFDKLASIHSANFRPSGNTTVFNTTQLNGRAISYGKSAAAGSPFIPVIFEIDNTGDLISGSMAEVYLKMSPIPDALVVPLSALIEEQGSFFVYIQTEGELFQKREVKLGATDGIHVQLLSGVTEGERVVTKGAYQIKLSSAAGKLPDHGHEH